MMQDEEKNSFNEFLEERQSQEKVDFFKIPAIKKAYFIGAYSRAVIDSSWYSDVSRKNTTFKNWLSNQIINFRNLERIFEMAYRFEQKLNLNIRNASEVRKLSHEIPATSAAGISSAKISYAFVAGFDDYNKFCDKYPLKKISTNKGENND
jgi:hypothetical protein